jgi:Flp pilus assembly protein TadG
MCRSIWSVSRPSLSSGRSDRGGVTLIITIVVGCGVMMGMGALVVDVGQIYVEREDLQSGADAAAIAVAKVCVSDSTHCAGQSANATQYANRNAKDNVSSVTLICGTAPGMSACPAPAAGLTPCVGSAPAGMTYVEVHTATMQADGSTLLPPTFGRLLVGNSSYNGRQYNGCARAAYGTPTGATAEAVAVSLCDWNAMTSNGTVFPAAPTATYTPPASAETAIYLHDPHGNSPTGCPKDPSGKTAPGGFGWLDDETGSCGVVTAVGDDAGGDPGNNVSNACQTDLQTKRNNHATILLPVYDTVSGNGAHTTYHVVGFAAWVLTGYRLSGFSAASWLSNTNLCSGSDRCLYGYFTRALITTGNTTLSSGTGYGASVITLVG